MAVKRRLPLIVIETAVITSRQWHRTMNAKLTVVLVATMLVATAVTPAAAARDVEPAMTVTLSEDGSATVVLTMTYDLDSDAERAAFRTLKNDSDTRTEVRERFRDRMANVVASASNATGREMSVETVSIDVRTIDEGTGVVALSVTWNGLAAVEDDRLVVTQPFTSGFETDRTVTLVAPAGYELADATPEPSTTADGRVSWEPGTSLDGFEATFRPGDGSGEQTTGEQSEETTESAIDDEEPDGQSTPAGEVPGFGVGTAVTALLGAALLWRRR